MRIQYKASAVSLLALVHALALCSGSVWADQGEITSVQVAQDLSRISIHSQGPLGKYSSFVIDRPYRLVIDFDSATIGSTKTKIRLDRPPISEIRLGYHNNRARVVVDFGENPVPPYRIERVGDVVVLSLGTAPPLPSGQAESGADRAPKKQAAKQTDRGAPQASRPVAKPAPEPVTQAPDPSATAPQLSRSETRDSDAASITVKDAGVKSNLVYIELVNKADPRISYRLIVDLDLENLTMRGASLSDAKGKIRKFHVTRTETEQLNSAPPGNRFSFGPKRYWSSSLTASAPTFSDAAVESDAEKRQRPSAKTGWPLRIEAFQPQPKDGGR